MTEDLGPITAGRKTGAERFVDNGNPLPFSLLDFWQWMGSDLIGNTFRGIVAEYLVAQALGIADDIRAEWRAFDLSMPDGRKIEVKSCAYLQSWKQRATSAVSFGIGPSRAWDSETGTMATELRRQADLYVFALLKHRTKATLNPMDVSQWDFYVLGASSLPSILGPGAKRLTLQQLLHLKPLIGSYHDLATLVRQAATESML